MNPDHLNELALRYYQNKEYSNAHECASHLRLIDPLNPRSYKTLGIINQGWEQYRWAVGAYKQALALNPTDTEVMFYLAQSYVYLKKFNDANDWLDATLQYNPHHHEAQLLKKIISRKVS